MARSRELKVVLSGDTRSLDRAFAKAGKGADRMGGAVKNAAKVGAVALGGGLVVALKKSVDAFAEAEKIGAQTNAVLKSTGQAANVSAKQVGDLATALSKKSGFDDEAIQSGENLLLTFTKIRNETGKGNDIFNQTTKTMLDMSVALGQDTKSSAIQLGKALNDPIKGVTALQRVGVSFTKQQRKQIDALVESGRTMDAQKLILKELQVEFGGSAEAAGNTFAGKINKAKVAVGNLGEAIGGPLAGGLAGAAQGLADFASKLTTSDRPARFFTTIGEQVSNLKDAIGGIFDDFGKRKAGGDSFAAALGGTISDAVSKVNWGAVGDTMSTGFTKGADFTGKLAPAVAEGISTALGQIDGRQLLSGLLRVVSEAIDALFSPSFWRENFAAIFSAVTIAIPVAKILKIPGADFLYRHISKPIFSAVGKLGKGLLSRLGKVGGDGVTGFLAGLESVAPKTAHLLLGLVAGSGKWLSGLPGKFKNAGGRAVDRITDAIGGGVGAIAGSVGKLVGSGIKKLGSLVPDWLRAGGRFARELIRGIVRGLTGLPGRVGGALKSGLGKVAGAVGGFLGIGEGIGRAMRPKGGSTALKGANRALAPIAAVGARFGLSVSSGLRPGASTSSGNASYHGTGEAVDLAGPPAAMLRTFRALKATVGGRLAELIYTPGGTGIRNGRPHTYSGAVAADHHDHIHAAVDLGTPGVGIGGVSHFSRRPKRGDGLGDGPGKGGGDVVGAFKRAIRKTGASQKASLALFEAGIVESGLRNLTYGDRDSKGALQLRVGLHGEELAMDPYRSALAFLTRGFTGRGGAIALASKLGTAGQVAQAVQGSAFPDRYDKVRTRALAYLGKMAAGESGGGGGASAPDLNEARERSGSRLVNSIIAPFMKDRLGPRGLGGKRRVVSTGIRTLSRRASNLGGLIEDADRSYSQQERSFGQSEEDLGTAGGRAQRVNELNALAELKRKTLDRQKRRARALSLAIRKSETMLKRLGTARRKAKGAKRAKINERMKTHVDRLDEWKAELKALGFEIRDTELDLGDLAKEAGEVAATPDTVPDAPDTPTAAEQASSLLTDIDMQERAGLLSPTDARQRRLDTIANALKGGYGALDQRQTWELMAQQIEVTGQQTQATNDLAQALKEVKGSIDRQNALAESSIGVELRQAQRAFGDMLSRELGPRVAARGHMPGDGQLSRV